MKKLSSRHLLIIQQMQEHCDSMVKELIKDKEHFHIHEEATERDGNSDEDIVVLLYVASASFEQIIERQINK